MGTYQGDFTNCDPNPCVGACCYGDGFCEEVTEATCDLNGGTYKGDGTTCDPNPCIGACCFDDGTCSVMGNDTCVNSNGTYQGDGTSCSPNPCPQPQPDCPTDSLYAQGPEFDDWNAGTSDVEAGFKRYDNFTDGGEVCDLHFWGMNLEYIPYYGFFECTEDPMTFDITFYADGGGQPGAETCTYTVAAPGPITWTVYDFYGNPYSIHEYNIDLPTCCVMPTGGWVSIEGTGGSCWFLWLNSADGDGTSCSDDGTGIDCTEDINLSMCITGNEGSFLGACCDDTIPNCVDNVLSSRL